MKKSFTIISSFTIMLLWSSLLHAQKIQQFAVTEVVYAPAEAVWEVIADDYGSIAYYHPRILNSAYANTRPETGEGIERISFFNKSGTRFLREKQVEYDAQNYTFKNLFLNAGKFPLDPENTFAVYQIIPVDETTSKIVFEMSYRTRFVLTGRILEATFKKLIRDLAIAVEHNFNTGDVIDRSNYKLMKKQYIPAS